MTRMTMALAAAVAALLATLLAQLCLGPFGLAPHAVFDALTNPASPDRFAVLTLGLPRYVVGALVGTALGASGAIFQTVTRNPIASPDMLGFGAGSATGAIVALLIDGGSPASAALLAVTGGLATGVVVYGLSGGLQGSPRQLVLSGIMISALLSAVNGYLLINTDVQDTQVVLTWLSGSLNTASWQDVPGLAAALVTLLAICLLRQRSFGLIEFDDAVVTTLGARPGLQRASWIVLGVLLVAIATAITGPIAFVALAAPHIARRMGRGRLPNVLPPALVGAVLVTGCDAIAANALPVHPPVGIVTGALGGFYLLVLLLRPDARSAAAPSS
ncbi:FecCD family ABC transporter permease [Burkholderia sp. 3C]